MTTARIALSPKSDSPQISRYVYGQFAEHLGHCIYGGIWVGEDSDIPNVRGIRSDVVRALREIRVPVIRWPGGCFADEYHWKDGVGPRKDRPSIYNSHWGGVVETNHFGTHEFFDLCDQVGCDAYICGNVGSGTVREMSEWVEYMSSPAHSPMADWRRKNGREEPWRLKFFGVGNESWGCGGSMRPEYYADLYRQYNTFVRNYTADRVQRFACGPNGSDYNWTTVLMDRARGQMDGLSLHYYTLRNGQWPPSGSATEFTLDEYRSVLTAARTMDELVTKHSEIMDRSDPERRVNLAVDEWGTWYAVEPGTNPGFLLQQNSMRDALVAAVHFDIFHRHAERVRMTNIAQMVNVLQTMLFTDGAKMVQTPTYWAFALYAPHQDAQRVDAAVETDAWMGLHAVSATASQRDGKFTVSASCLDPGAGRTVSVTGLPDNLQVVRARILRGEHITSHNTFDRPHEAELHPLEARISGGRLEFDLYPASVATVELA